MISGIVTALLMASFLGIAVWAWSSRRQRDFEAAAQLPLRDEPAGGCGCGGCGCGKEPRA